MTNEGLTKTRKAGLAYALSESLVQWARENGYAKTLHALDEMQSDYRVGYQRRQKLAHAEGVIERAQKKLIQMQAELATLKGSL